jgi:methionyl-tRNA formyltransferase
MSRKVSPQPCYQKITDDVSKVPIKAAAKDLDLPIHQLDDFRNFNRSYNLIIAVSFGLLVPADIINRAKYGGLNVHPSFLPE